MTQYIRFGQNSLFGSRDTVQTSFSGHNLTTRTESTRNTTNKSRITRGHTNCKLQKGRPLNFQSAKISNEEDDPIDLTENKCIKPTAIPFGVSILKDIKTIKIFVSRGTLCPLTHQLVQHLGCRQGSFLQSL